MKNPRVMFLNIMVPWCNWKHDEAYNLELQIRG